MSFLSSLVVRLSSTFASAITARRLLIGLVLIGTVLRLWLIAINPIDPASSSADDGDYYQRALRLAITGQYIDDSWLIRPPGHVFFFALWLRIGMLMGDIKLGLLLIKLAQVGVAALQVTLGFAVARRLFHSAQAGILFAAFLALWFPFVEQPSLLFSELLYNTLFLAHVWFLLRFDGNEHKHELLLSGLFLGMTALTRSPALYSLGFVAVWLFARNYGKRRAKSEERRTQDKETRRQGDKETMRQSLTVSSFFLHPTSFILNLVIVAIGCLAIVLPWTARNYVVYQRIIPVDTLGQTNLWLDLEEPELRNGKIEQMRQLPQADRAAFAMAKAREILAVDPLRPFRYMWPTFRHVWKLQFVEDYYLRESFYDRPLRPFAPLGLFGDLIWLVFTGAGLVALLGPVREGWHNRLFVLLWLGYTLLTVIVFHVEPRYLLPIWMLLALYGAGRLAVLKTTDDRRPTTVMQSSRLSVVGRRSSVVAQLVVLFAFATLLVTYRDYPAIITRGETREQAMRAGDTAFARGDYAKAEARYRAALQAQPNFADASVQVALAQLAQGQPDAAAATAKDVKRRTALLVGLVAARSPALVADLNYAEATTGLDVQQWTMDWTRPQPTRAIRFGDGRDMGYIAGFSAAEADAANTFRWTTGQATVRVPLPKPIQTGDTLALRLATPQPIVLKVRVGSNEQALTVEPGPWRVYVLRLPQLSAGSTTLTVQLDSQTFIPARRDPASTDLRQLGIMVSDVYVR